ncbi:hypothetical protein SAMN06264348_101296 [Oceanospirillum linum]|nr:hypothetical protein SAMN04489856_101295 [Oleiphilus messinensis]SMP02998.1 hypothetical protein SAMN06264348_101296 [Oceanospirillum linum]
MGNNAFMQKLILVVVSITLLAAMAMRLLDSI